MASDPSDRRRTLVLLTARGEEYARAVASAQRALDIAEFEGELRNSGAADAVLRAVFPDPAGGTRVDQLVPAPSD